MVQQKITKLIIFSIFLFFTPAGHAQLGPKDGNGLDPVDLDRVGVGDLAPDFTLEDTDGTRITLSNFRNKKNVVLVFYRGRW